MTDVPVDASDLLFEARTPLGSAFGSQPGAGS